MIQLSTRYGQIVTPDWDDDLIVTSLRKHGEWAFIEQSLLAATLREGDRVWDGGAFLGTFGLGVVQLATEQGRAPASLLAIEPGADINDCLNANLSRNCPCPATVAACAISLHEGLLQLDEADDANHGARSYQSVDPEEETGGSGYTVPSLPLWELRNRHGNYDCLKLDVEGMEFDALRSDFEYLQQEKPVIWAECNESRESLRILEAMMALGYDPLYVAFPAFRADNFNKSPDLIYPMAYEAALLACNAERRAGLEAIAGPEVILQPVKSGWDLRQALWSTPRWAQKDWVDMSRPQLIALLGRMSRGEELGEFLVQTPE